MAKATKICKVCGKTYEYCHTLRPNSVFRWQDVACCPEHGNIYFTQIMESRGVKPVNNNEEPAPVVAEEVAAEEVLVEYTPAVISEIPSDEPDVEEKFYDDEDDEEDEYDFDDFDDEDEFDEDE